MRVKELIDRLRELDPDREVKILIESHGIKENEVICDIIRVNTENEDPYLEAMLIEEPLLPEIGKTYNCFDDGKITPSRLYHVTVKDIKRLSECSDKIKEMWRQNVIHCGWMGYARFKDPHIIIGDSDEDDDLEVYIAPAVHTATGYVSWGSPEIKPFWFGLGDWFGSGTLDVDGKLTEWAKSEFEDLDPDFWECKY